MVFERLSAVEPSPKGELAYVNPFTLLVAVVLSAQATDAGVNKATRTLFAVVDTPEKMAALGENALAERIRTIGLYRSKAKHVIALSRALIEKHGGRYLVRGEPPMVVEGDWAPERMVILEFPSRENAQAFLADPAAQSLFAIRHRTTVSKLVLVDGCA